MRREAAFVCALILLTLTVGSVPSGAQTTAVGPYLAMPAWDQKLACDTPATCQRFVVLSNWNSEAVLDRETGLVWERTPSATALDWAPAVRACEFKHVGDRFGWRLPTIQELLSLAVPGDVAPPFTGLGPFLPPGHPFVLPSATHGFWSSTTDRFPPTGEAFESARGADFADGAFTSFMKNGNGGKLNAWCVRGGSGLDGQ